MQQFPWHRTADPDVLHCIGCPRSHVEPALRQRGFAERRRFRFAHIYALSQKSRVVFLFTKGSKFSQTFAKKKVAREASLMTFLAEKKDFLGLFLRRSSVRRVAKRWRQSDSRRLSSTETFRKTFAPRRPQNFNTWSPPVIAKFCKIRQ